MRVPLADVTFQLAEQMAVKYVIKIPTAPNKIKMRPKINERQRW
jgi:hypothetical protein